MYSKRPNLVLGFHGCGKKTADLIIKGETFMNESTNDYDWLGNGIYFWENNLIRALEFAKEQKKRLGKDGTPKVENPAAVGAIIQNIPSLNIKENIIPYDSVRGVFWEGDDFYPLAGFKEKNHIQICICNPNFIKGFFRPLSLDEKYLKP